MKIINIFLGLLIGILAVWLLFDWFNAKKDENELLSWINISVVEIDNSILPGILVDIENKGPRVVGRTHFRLVFRVADKVFCRVDKDYGNFKPNEKKRILLKCKKASFNIPLYPSVKVNYFLQVFPEMKKGLNPLEGEFFLKQ